jgi:hypothetical protein
MTINANTNVKLEGRGVLTLRPNDHVATGGEGSVYRKANTIIKLYTDPSKMRRDGMPAKIALLTGLQHKHIVAPQGLVTTESDQHIGYYMPAVDGEALSRIFTNDFRQREGFGDDDASKLVDRMHQAVQFAHNQGATMVDANELNWLVTLSQKDGPQPKAIDVDSWAIDRWPATVIMPSIRDWHSKEFNALTDWFAWGIVTFQVYTGTHPFKGTLTGYRRNDMQARMKANASVFAAGVKLSHAVRDFSCIPPNLLNWYEATFQNGERAIPPSPFQNTGTVAQVTKIQRTVLTTTGSLKYERLLARTSDEAIRIFPCGVVLLASGQLYDLETKQNIGMATSRDCEVVSVDGGGGWLKADWVNARLSFSYISRLKKTEQPLTLQLQGHKLVRYENRLFVVTDQGLTELQLRMFAQAVLGVGQTWGAMVNSTRWFDGVGIQDTMGATYVFVPFGTDACAQVRVKELDGLVPIAAKAGNRFVAIMTLDQTSGQYRKVELTFGKDYKSYQIWQGDADTPDLNMANLPKGVSAIVAEDGVLNIFVPTSGALSKINDKDITTDMILGNWENVVVFIRKGAVWTVRS